MLFCDMWWHYYVNKVSPFCYLYMFIYSPVYLFLGCLPAMVTKDVQKIMIIMMICWIVRSWIFVVCKAISQQLRNTTITWIALPWGYCYHGCNLFISVCWFVRLCGSKHIRLVAADRFLTKFLNKCKPLLTKQWNIFWDYLHPNIFFYFLTLRNGGFVNS